MTETDHAGVNPCMGCQTQVPCPAMALPKPTMQFIRRSERPGSHTCWPVLRIGIILGAVVTSLLADVVDRPSHDSGNHVSAAMQNGVEVPRLIRDNPKETDIAEL